jgi:hypothetical protein
MVVKFGIGVKDLAKTHLGKSYYNGLYSLTTYIHLDDNEVVTKRFALDKEAIQIVTTKNMTVSIGETTPNRAKQTKLF